MANSMYRLISKHDSVKVMENLTTGQKSLYASNSFNSGDIISAFNSRKTLKEPNYLTVQLDDDVHILLEPEYLQYINHSCQPNAFFDTKTLKLIALTKIDSDDELTYCYPSTEWNMQQPFTCMCKKDKCLGRIQGARHLPNEIIPQYRFSDSIQRKLNEKH
ncbi:hypothetical protein I4U23_016050 [Adineta vaga]|nr:hypothetical protein I4U23_016050 [Adineta vaga]